jgi:hypothetical protein
MYPPYCYSDPISFVNKMTTFGAAERQARFTNHVGSLYSKVSSFPNFPVRHHQQRQYANDSCDAGIGAPVRWQRLVRWSAHRGLFNQFLLVGCSMLENGATVFGS